MIKTILVPVSDSNTENAVLASALAVARAFDAHLEMLHVRVDAAALAATMSTDGSGASLIGGLVEQLESEANQREEKARQLFQQFCERERVFIADSPDGQARLSAQWLRETGIEAYWVAEYARSTDLLVVGRPKDDQGTSLDTIETALLSSGRPVLIPAASPLAALPDTVVIAWKAVPEAARAVTAAMPILSRARQIEVLTVADQEGVSDVEGARLAINLRWHGFNASARHLKPAQPGAVETLLAAAAERDALVVMGAYGHTRFREWIFGGFTQHVLRAAEVPVLMMH